jgi:myo-inositol 2-dehydrogenase/D-chiro-inositol 1-dehydrogenase
MTGRDRPLRIGLLGAGRMGALHAATLARVRGARLAAVHDPDPEAAAALAPEGATVAAGDAELIESAEVDAVLIASSTDAHAAQVEAAARAGKAIFCEKPVARDVGETRRALATVTEHDAPFQIGFDRRFDPAFGGLAAAVHAGAIGRPESYRAFSSDPALPRRDYHADAGGLILDFMIHDLDMARHVMGEVRRVRAVGRVLTEAWIGEHGDVDTAVVTLEFASGAIGVLQAAWRTAHGHDLRVEAYGSEGRLVAEDPHRTAVTWFDGAGVHGDHVAGFQERFAAAYRAELQAFVDAVRDGRPPSPGPIDALRSERLTAAAAHALRTGLPVDLDVDAVLAAGTGRDAEVST